MNHPKPNFTQRPWHTELGEIHEVRDAEGGRICILTQLRGRHGLGGRRADEESLANARLIAAAPELYEALKACRLQMLQSNNDSEYAQEANELASAAIAKAEG